MSEHDPVNKPTHYTSYKGIEVIQLTEQMTFLKGNVVKYVARAGLKGDSIHAELQDLEKAKWYLEREIERVRSIRDNCIVCNTIGHSDNPPVHDERALEIRQTLGTESAYKCAECGSENPLSHWFHPNKASDSSQPENDQQKH